MYTVVGYMAQCKSLEALALERVISCCSSRRVHPPKLGDVSQLPKVFHNVIWKTVHRRRFARVLDDLTCIGTWVGVGERREELGLLKHADILDMSRRLCFSKGQELRRWQQEHRDLFVFVLNDFETLSGEWGYEDLTPAEVLYIMINEMGFSVKRGGYYPIRWNTLLNLRRSGR